MTNDERAARLMLGGTEKMKIGREIVLWLLWEVWRDPDEVRKEALPRPRFCIERAHISGRLVSKQAYDDFEEAAKAFDAFEREYAIESAKEALGLNE